MANFFGQYRVSLDAQHRLMVPVRLRDGLGGENARLYMSPGLEERNRYLIVYGQTFWTRISTQIKAFRNFKDDLFAERKIKKHFFGSTHVLEIDATGRVLLPNDLYTYAGLEAKVLLVGMQDFIELWAEDSWQVNNKPDEIHRVVEEAAKQGIRLY